MKTDDEKNAARWGFAAGAVAGVVIAVAGMLGAHGFIHREGGGANGTPMQNPKINITEGGKIEIEITYAAEANRANRVEVTPDEARRLADELLAKARELK